MELNKCICGGTAKAYHDSVTVLCNGEPFVQCLKCHLRALNPEQWQQITSVVAVKDARIAELEKSNSFLINELEQLANFNPDWDRLEALTTAHREVCAKLAAFRECLTECNRLSMEDGGLSYEFDNYFKTVVEPLLEAKDGE